MTDELIIPREHWETPGGLKGSQNPHYVTGWERLLRSRVYAQPDPAMRFSNWLTEMAAGAPGMPGPRVIFIEPPYLEWAETILKIVELTEKETRQKIAAEILSEDR